jgi:error-prone DNA polymerase
LSDERASPGQEQPADYRGNVSIEARSHNSGEGKAGKVQRASGVIHLIVESVSDLTADLKTVSGLDVPFPLVAGRVDEARHGGGGPDNREGKPPEPKPRDIYVPDTHIDTLKLKARNFR